MIARLMLTAADVLLLDEPTNDLDIPTLEILEQNLLDFRGALVLVTHDRYMLDRVSTTVLGLDGFGAAERFADYAQWEVWQQTRTETSNGGSTSDLTKRPEKQATGIKRKLSYLEAREYATLEERIEQAEQDLKIRKTMLDDPTIASDALQLVAVQEDIESAEKALDSLLHRWAELEEKQG